MGTGTLVGIGIPPGSQSDELQITLSGAAVFTSGNAACTLSINDVTAAGLYFAYARSVTSTTIQFWFGNSSSSTITPTDSVTYYCIGT
jgi:hypothetical protein